MNREELLRFAGEFFGTCTKIMQNKNKDYTGAKEVEDPFSNFRAVEMFGIETETGFITRMTDKMARIGSFVKRGERAVKDESVKDTLLDLANYAMLFAAYLESTKTSRDIKNK